MAERASQLIHIVEIRILCNPVTEPVASRTCPRYPGCQRAFELDPTLRREGAITRRV
jgi:hypothetical protein